MPNTTETIDPTDPNAVRIKVLAKRVMDLEKGLREVQQVIIGMHRTIASQQELLGVIAERLMANEPKIIIPGQPGHPRAG